MTKRRTVRLEEEVENLVDTFLRKNSIPFNKLVNIAIKDFFSKPHTIELGPISDDEWERASKKAYRKHKKTMGELSK